MQIKVLAFAQACDQLGFRERAVECTSDETPRAIVMRLAPGLHVENVRVAIDQEYADWDAPIGNAAEIALIPPVSGG